MLWQDLDRLARLLAVRIPLDRSVRTLARQARQPEIRTEWEAVARVVAGGTRLADALRQRGLGEATLHTLIHAGEETGQLADTLRRITAEQRSRRRLQRQLASASAYPLTVGVLAIGIVTTLLTFVAPQFAEVYRQIPQLQGRPLPWLTRMVMELPHVLLPAGLVLVMLGSAGWLGLQRLARQQAAWRLRAEAWADAVPWWGRTRRQYALVHHLQTTATALSVGLPLPTALRLNASPAWQELARRVEGGQALSQAYLQGPQPDPTVHSLLEVGEETHSLPARFAEAAELLQEELEARLNSVKTWLEPALIVTLAAVVGTLVLAVFLPILELLQQVGP